MIRMIINFTSQALVRGQCVNTGVSKLFCEEVNIFGLLSILSLSSMFNSASMFISKAAIDSTYISGVHDESFVRKKSTGSWIYLHKFTVYQVNTRRKCLACRSFSLKNVGNYYSLMNKLNLSSYSVQALSSQLRATQTRSLSWRESVLWLGGGSR